MAEDAIELDYDELNEDKLELASNELPQRYQRQKSPSIFSEEYENAGKAEKESKAVSPPPAIKKPAEPEKRKSLFTSGRLSVVRRGDPDQEKNVAFTKYKDRYSVYDHDEEEEEEEKMEKAVDSDSEDDAHFRKTNLSKKTYFPDFPVNRAAVKEELRVTAQHLRNTIVVDGVEKLLPYDVLKVFTRYNAICLCPIDNHSCLIQFEEEKAPLKMMVEMSKSLTTNLHRFTEHLNDHKEIVRNEGKQEEEVVEEGEISDDEGEVIEGESMAKSYIFKIGYPDVRQTAHVVYINSSKYNIADNNFRAVTAHVPKNRALLVKFATDGEVRASFDHAKATVLRRKTTDANGVHFWSKRQGKAGLDIYDKDGIELEWDFEHDTRFFEEKNQQPVEKEWEKPALQTGKKGAVKVRGRGAKRFLGEDSETMNVDIEPKKKTTRVDDELNWRQASGSARYF